MRAKFKILPRYEQGTITRPTKGESSSYPYRAHGIEAVSVLINAQFVGI
jgi:hypothetical protein